MGLYHIEVRYELVFNESVPGVLSHAGLHLGLLAAAHELLDLDPLGAQDAAFQDLLGQGLSPLL